MKFPSLVLLAALSPVIAFASPSLATADPAPAKPDAAAASDDNERVCRVERTLGSNLNKRVCRTRAQWREEGEMARDGMVRMQRRNPHNVD